MATLHEHEVGNGGYSQGEPTGTAPVLDPTFGEGDGNVGIIRSPVRAIALPDNRHEAENAKFLRERTSDLSRPRVLHCYREGHSEA